MTSAGIFLTHQRSPRIRRHFRRLVAESGHLVTWHFVFNPDTGARPKAPFAYEDPAQVLAGRYRAMVRNGGIQGGYLDTLLIPVLRALPADHLWVIEYDVDYAGRWDDLFGQFAGQRQRPAHDDAQGALGASAVAPLGDGPGAVLGPRGTVGAFAEPLDAGLARPAQHVRRRDGRR